MTEGTPAHAAKHRASPLDLPFDLPLDLPLVHRGVDPFVACLRQGPVCILGLLLGAALTSAGSVTTILSGILVAMVLLLVLLLPASFFGIYYTDKKKRRSSPKKSPVSDAAVEVEMHNVEMNDAYELVSRKRGDDPSITQRGVA